jgi:hypothetical protein
LNRSRRIGKRNAAGGTSTPEIQLNQLESDFAEFRFAELRISPSARPNRAAWTPH